MLFDVSTGKNSSPRNKELALKFYRNVTLRQERYFEYVFPLSSDKTMQQKGVPSNFQIERHFTTATRKEFEVVVHL